MSAEELPAGNVGFALLHPGGHVTYECRGRETLLAAIGRHIPDLAMTKCRAPVRCYYSDPSGPDPAMNILADTVTFAFGLAMYWWDLVAISMEPDPVTDETPPLRPEVLATLTQVVAGLDTWGPTWGPTWQSQWQ